MYMTIVLLLVAIFIFSIIYINLNNAVVEYIEYNKKWKNTTYEFDSVPDSDKPSLVYADLFADDNIKMTMDKMKNEIKNQL